MVSVREKGKEEERVRFPYLARAGVQWGGLATVTDGGGGGACEAAALGARVTTRKIHQINYMLKFFSKTLFHH